LESSGVTVMLLGILKRKQTVNPALTVVLLHLNGSIGTVDYTDSSPYSRTFTAVNGTPLLANNTSAGRVSLAVSSSGEYIETADAPELDLGSSDFTIEFFVTPSSITGISFWLERWFGGGAFAYQLYADNDNSLHFDIRGVTQLQLLLDAPANSIINNYRNHIAIVRHGNTITLYINGVAVASGSFVGAVVSTTNPLAICKNINGYIDEIRVRKQAMYLADFTPPSAPFTF
jgi:hypothetical protein